VVTPDSTVLVAGFLTDHPCHEQAESALAEARDERCFVAHTMAESYAVLSAPGFVFRAEPGAVLSYWDELLEGSAPIQPRPGVYREALGLLAGAARGGGPIYDALIALTARDADATLISLDRRAKPVYELCGADVRFLDAD